MVLIGITGGDFKAEIRVAKLINTLWRMIRIKAFRAVDDIDSCEIFAQGHTKVLEDHGIKPVASSNSEWFFNPTVYGILILSSTSDEVYGGARLHIAGGAQPLPIETAIGKLDNKIYDLVKGYADKGTGEFCGLWNDKKAAGKGYNILLGRASIARASVVIAGMLDIRSLFALAASYTLRPALNVGFEVETSLGDKGTFSYPKPDLRAVVAVLRNLTTLSAATLKEKESILELIANPRQQKIEIGPKGPIEVEYDLTIPRHE